MGLEEKKKEIGKIEQKQLALFKHGMSLATLPETDNYLIELNRTILILKSGMESNALQAQKLVIASKN